MPVSTPAPKGSMYIVWFGGVGVGADGPRRDPRVQVSQTFNERRP